MTLEQERALYNNMEFLHEHIIQRNKIIDFEINNIRTPFSWEMFILFGQL